MAAHGPCERTFVNTIKIGFPRHDSPRRRIAAMNRGPLPRRADLRYHVMGPSWYRALERGYSNGRYTCFRKTRLFIVYHIDMKVTPIDSSRFADKNYTKFHVNRTNFNEASEKLYK